MGGRGGTRRRVPGLGVHIPYPPLLDTKPFNVARNTVCLVPSSSWSGHHPFTVATRVQLPLGHQTTARSVLSPRRRERHHIAGGRNAKVEQRLARQCVGMVADVPAIGALNHNDRGVVVDGDDPNRDAGQ